MQVFERHFDDRYYYLDKKFVGITYNIFHIIINRRVSGTSVPVYCLPRSLEIHCKSFFGYVGYVISTIARSIQWLILLNFLDDIK